VHHVLFGIIAGLRHRRQLAGMLLRAEPQLATKDIDPAILKGAGVTTLALDFDGVMSSHGESEPLPEASSWLTRCCQAFGEERLFILSNKPAPARIDWFRANHPGIRFIAGVRKKPYPDGLQAVISQTGVQPAEVLLVDDRLLTGGLASLLAGTRFCLVTAPYVNLARRPAVELLFMMLRSLERAVARLP
jgi:predicted HAD superfamily phosphohydrolase YqeG